MKFMEKTDHGSEIKKILAEFEGLLDGLMYNHSAQSNLEMDLALEKLRKMYDHLLLWKNEPAMMKPEPQEEPLEEAPFIPAPVEEPIEETDHQEEEPAEEMAINEESTEPIEEMAVPEESTEPEVEPVDLKLRQPNPVKTGNVDLFSSFSTQREDNKHHEPEIKETIGDRIQKSKIVTLKEAIGINEKFFFLNELFGGNLTEYNKAIAHLDSLATLEEATAYLEALQANYNWTLESDAAVQLIQFIERKWR
jgi:hypothetical protein